MPFLLYMWKSIRAFILMNQVCLDMGSFPAFGFSPPTYSFLFVCSYGCQVICLPQS